MTKQIRAPLANFGLRLTPDFSLFGPGLPGLHAGAMAALNQLIVTVSGSADEPVCAGCDPSEGPMPIDLQCQALLDQMNAAGVPDIASQTPADVRARARRTKEVLPPGPSVAHAEDVTIEVENGSIAIRAYVPNEAPVAAMVYFHGGGWVVGSIDDSDGPNRVLANETSCIVFAVDYRLAPEFPFPVPVEDSYTAALWVAANLARFDAERLPLIVAGDSAGATIAAAVAMLAKERDGPTISGQVLFYPAADATFETESYKLFGLDRIPSTESMKWFWNHYAPEDAQRFHPLASILRAPNLTGLPPALIQTAEYDPLRDEGEAFAQRLSKAGVDVRCDRRPGMIHGYITFAQILDGGLAAITDADAFIRALAGSARTETTADERR